jgi:hypothetical protein
MRLLQCEGVPFLQGEIPALAAPLSGAIPQPRALTEAELDALHSWAAKHGFVLINERDVALAECVWREMLVKEKTA